jgi:hypothetical protein
MSTVDPSPKDPTGFPGPPVPKPVPAVDTNLLDPAVIAEEVERGEQENEEAHG